jgi:hypothetical protein
VLQALRISIAKRQKNILNLAATLVVGRKSEEEVVETLDTASTSYKTGLTKTITALRE